LSHPHEEVAEEIMSPHTVVLIAYSEIALKRRKRGFMERYLLNSVLSWARRRRLEVKAVLDSGRVVVEGELPEDVRRVPGVHHVIKAKVFEKLPPEELKEVIASSFELEPPVAVRVRRADKEYPAKSVELAAAIGEALGLPVNLRAPRTVLYVEVRNKVYAYTSNDVLEGVGGLPYGVEGKASVSYGDPLRGLLASALLARRGARVYPSKPYPLLDKLDEALPRPLVIGVRPFSPSAGSTLLPGEPCVPPKTLEKVKLMLGGVEVEGLDRFRCTRARQGARDTG